MGDTEKRLLFAVALSMAIFLIWSVIFQPPRPSSTPGKAGSDEDGERTPTATAVAAHPTEIAARPTPAPVAEEQTPAQEERPSQSVHGKRNRALQNVFDNNREIQQRGQQMLQQLYKQSEDGVQIK